MPLVSLNFPSGAFTTDAGVDILSFGGTKNGMMFGEAVCFLN
jgi:threonine aldolase